MEKIIFEGLLSKEDFAKGSDYRKKVLFNFSKNPPKPSFVFKKWIKNYHNYLRPLFKKLNNGKFAQTLIFNFNLKENKIEIQKKQKISNEPRLKEIVKRRGYSFTEELWNRGLVTKTKEGDTLIFQVLESYKKEIVNEYQKKDNKKEKLLKEIEEIKEGKFIAKIKNPKTKIIESVCLNEKDKAAQIFIASKQKQINQIEKELNEMIEDENVLNEYLNDLTSLENLCLVFSLNPRLIASQSTKTSWSSCMTLNSNSNFISKYEYIGSGMSVGVFIVYLGTIKNKDSKTKVIKPLARVLVKPYFKETNEENSKKLPEVFWYTDLVYPRGKYTSFRQAVTKLLQKFNLEVSNGIYKIDQNIYVDSVSEISVTEVFKYVQIGDFSDIQKRAEENPAFIKEMIEKYPKEVFLNWDFKIRFPNIEIESINLSNTDIRELPKGIMAKNWDLSNTNITVFEL